MSSKTLSFSLTFCSRLEVRRRALAHHLRGQRHRAATGARRGPHAAHARRNPALPRLAADCHHKSAAAATWRALATAAETLFKAESAKLGADAGASSSADAMDDVEDVED